MIFFPSFLLSILLSGIIPSNSLTYNISILISGAETKQNSRIFIAVYRPSDPFPEFGKGWKNEIFPVRGKTQNILLDLPKGTYAIAIFQDINNNSKLDKNVFGYPTEPFAFSNNFRPILGKPDFKDCSFIHSGENTSISVKLIR